MRVTPLNIVVAAFLTYGVWEFIFNDASWGSLAWTLLVIILLLTADQLFRVFLKNLRNIWWVEAVFVVLLLLFIWIVNNFWT